MIDLGEATFHSLFVCLASSSCGPSLFGPPAGSKQIDGFSLSQKLGLVLHTTWS